MLFSPACVEILRAVIDDGVLVLAQLLLRRLGCAGVDHVAATRDIAMLSQLADNSVEQAFAGARLAQPFLEGPDGCTIRDLAGMPQAGSESPSFDSLASRS